MYVPNQIVGLGNGDIQVFPFNYHYYSSYLIIYILWSIISLCHHVSFYVMSDGFFSFQCMKDNHIPHHSQFIDIGSEILN